MGKAQKAIEAERQRKNDYAKKLKDPRWQKKRLEILERDKWTCQICCDRESTLHVHHIKYFNGNPWDIENKYLITMCEKCHTEEPEVFYKYSKNLMDILKDLGFTSNDLMNLRDCFEDYPPYFSFDPEKFDTPLKITNAIAEALSRKE